MTETRPKREVWLEAMAAYVLEHGLNTASLRPLAKAAGTSDRMLIYHFGSKDGLVAELLTYLAGNLTVMLSEALPPRRFETRAECVRTVVDLLRLPAARGFMRVWLDIISAAAQGQDLHRATGERIVDGFVDWLEARVPASEADPRGCAMTLITLIDGILVLDAVGQTKMADAVIADLAAE